MKQLLVAVVIAVVVGLCLPGCAGGGTVEGICAFQPLGENEAGINFFRFRCQPEK
jgi:hypothetical protein